MFGKRVTLPSHEAVASEMTEKPPSVLLRVDKGRGRKALEACPTSQYRSFPPRGTYTRQFLLKSPLLPQSLGETVILRSIYITGLGDSDTRVKS